MNERIRQLAVEAGFYANPDVEKLEKFALLIGRECLILADSMRDNLDEDGEKQQALGAAWVGLAITRHFGFEE